MLELVCCKTNEQSKASRVSCHGMVADIPLAAEMIPEESGKMRGESGHTVPPVKSCSPAAAISLSKTGVASRYQ